MTRAPSSSQTSDQATPVAPCNQFAVDAAYRWLIRELRVINLRLSASLASLARRDSS